MLLKNTKKKWFVNFIIHTGQLLLLTLRPLLGPRARCRFTVSCTDYAIDALETQPLFTAIKNITLRVLSCLPFVPMAKSSE